MADSKPPRDLPQVPDSVDPAIRRPLSRVIEEMQRLLEFRGDPLDAALTLRKAIARGLIDSVGRSNTGSVTYVNTFPTTEFTGSEPPDLTPPPTVTGLTAAAGFTQVLVEFDAPTYTQGHGNLQTNIYASKKAAGDATLPTFGDAVLVFAAPGALTVVSIPSELNTRWHIWAKYKTVDGVESVTAAGGVNGVTVTTGQDIAQLLDVLTGEITESQLYSALNTRINLIDAADSVAGSVSARVKTETDARAAAITLARSDFAAADAATLASANSYVTTYAYAKSTVDGALSALDTTLRAAFASADSATLATANAYTYSRATIDSSIASSASTLTTAFGAADAATLASANAFTYSRSAIDGAISSSSSTLTAAYTAADSAVLSAADAAAASRDSTVLATANAYTYSRATIDTAIASSASTLTAAYGSAISSAVGVEASARASLDGFVQALYTVRAQVSSGGSTMAGGFGLSATATSSGGPTIDFGVIANRFYVGAPNDGSAPGIPDALPFIIQASPTTINGVAVPAGTYIRDAFILNGSITNAKIGNAAIDDAKIANLSAAKVTFGVMSGDRIDVNTLHANRIQSGTLTANMIVAGTLSAGWVFAGSLSAATGTFAGSLSAANGTFAGNLSASSGTLGNLEVLGHVRSGQTAWSTGTGFWLGMDSGVPKFSVGTASEYMRWTGSALELKLATVTASISPSNLSVGAVSNGTASYSGGTVSVSGGTSPYTYAWSVDSAFTAQSGGVVDVWVTSGINAFTAYFSGRATNVDVTVFISCAVTDANGRTARGNMVINATHGTPPPP